ncbi:hypothetical protein LINGRAHAP2_LOCUS28941 [Linum grandiflorum]
MMRAWQGRKIAYDKNLILPGEKRSDSGTKDRESRGSPRGTETRDFSTHPQSKGNTVTPLKH